ncbi:oxidoreductase [Rhodococcus sp. SC4]|nr:oxidoreductase [Rhodococcus sp. SC4]
MADKKLAGQVALVTGGSRGIGAGIATRLAADGASVALTYSKSKDSADQVVKNIQAQGGRAYAIRADSSIAEDVVASVSSAVAHFGGLHILVNNAGGGTFQSLDELTLEQIDQVLSVNVRATVVATKAALEHISTGGRIINIGSINADRMPFPGGSTYALSKGAVASFTRGLARELGPRGITVNNVQPGPVDTDGNPADGPAAGLILEALAVDRFGTVEEIGAFVSYLAGPDASYITGASHTIDGGFGA